MTTTRSEAAIESSRGERVGGLRGWVGLLAAFMLAGMIAIELFAWLLPQRLLDDEFWYIQLATVSFFFRVFQHYMAFGTGVLSLVLMFAKWRRASVAAAVLALALIAPYAADFAPKNPPAAASQAFRLMSINLYFHNRDETAIMRSIDAANPDVVTLVEVTPWSMENIVQKLLASGYRYVDQPRKPNVGMVLSRLPWEIGTPAIVDGSPTTRVPVVFWVNGQEIALYAVHLVSPGDSKLVEENRHQVALYSAIASAERRATIITGDCNFSQLTPNAEAFHRAGLRSAHELIGFGLGNTWGPRWYPILNRFPGVRIDHIWLSPHLTVTSSRIGLDTGSDHRPVIADIAFAKHT